MLLRSLNYSHVYPLWDTPDEKGMTFFFQTPECCTVVYMYWKRKKKKNQGNLVFGETRSYTHQQRFPYRPTCGEGMFSCWKAWRDFILIIYSFLSTGEMTPRRGTIRWPIVWGVKSTQGRFEICPLLPTKQSGDRILRSATQLLCGMKA